MKNGKERKFATRQKPLYNNCFLEANDGELLCTIDKKKAMWYVTKQIGEIVKEDPFTVRLNFEPAGRAVGQTGLYYQTAKENKCVVCGESERYNRKNVVPREYRKFFPCKWNTNPIYLIRLLTYLLYFSSCHEGPHIS